MSGGLVPYAADYDPEATGRPGQPFSNLYPRRQPDDEAADNCEGQDDSEGDDPLPREGEHPDDYNVRMEEAMFGPQDADLDEEE